MSSHCPNGKHGGHSFCADFFGWFLLSFYRWLIRFRIIIFFRYDFYLVPQTITQGTTSPTLYNVIHDTTTEMMPDRVQLWTYKMCHIYYNWSGTVRVPAVMQYATKLSFLVANSIHRLPNNGLENKLYFL